MLSQAGPEVMATAFFGVLRLSLDDDESVAALLMQARQFADALHRLKTQYDAALAQRSVPDPFDPPRSTYNTATREGLLAARRDLDQRIARAGVRRGK
jgi:hypothetical protein